MLLKRLLLFFIGALLMPGFTCFAKDGILTIGAQDQEVAGYIVKRVWLDHFEMPVVTLSAAVWKLAPAGATGAPQDSTYPATEGAGAVVVRLGKELKQPFAWVKIPAWKKDSEGRWHHLQSANLQIEEAAPRLPLALKTTGFATQSVLSAGDWRKLRLSERGVYKVDYDLFTSLGFTGGIPSAQIRLYGNGGTMLPEANGVARPDDLVENAIEIHDGGDGSFDPGDYFLFYANGPTGWSRQGSQFIHAKNLYSDYSYYFLTSGAAAGLRIAYATQPAAAGMVVDSFDFYAAHETDEENPGQFGKVWWGDKMTGLQSGVKFREITFQLPGAPATLKAETRIAGRSTAGGSSMRISANGAQLGAYNFAPVVFDMDQNPVHAQSASYTVNGNSQSSFTFRYDFTPGNTDAIGYIDYLRINARTTLKFNGTQLSFRDLTTAGAGVPVRFQLANVTNETRVWDVTNPLQPALLTTTSAGSVLSFYANTDTLREYIAFGNSYKTPEDAGAVANQNLHALPQADLIIIAPPEFKEPAEELADFHRIQDGIRVNVAYTKDIYNEFSSGGQDISAIRDFIRMFYLRAGTDTADMPKNVLLFGSASYDYKNRLAGNTNLVPTYEAHESVVASASYICDDFFVFLDDNEGINLPVINTLDAGVGRIPAKKIEEANAIVNKILIYRSPASHGPWRLANTYVADNEDGAGMHLLDAELMADTVNDETRIFNDTKIYLDNIPFVSTPGGTRAPAATKALNDAIYKGTALINYTGHGSITTLAHERILSADDYTTWKNLNALPFMITATCDFARFDRPLYPSAGEQIILKPDGGAIAMLTTTQLVYASNNRPINAKFLATQYHQRNNGDWYTFGAAFRLAKNAAYLAGIDTLNVRAFTLLGNPALQPAFPRQHVRTDSIISLSSGAPVNTLSAMGAYQLSGSVTDIDGNVLPFNGQVNVTIYDKPRKVSVRTKQTNAARTYYVNDNIIHKGIATVTSGRFTMSFVTPKDINYDLGKGKISYYASNGEYDAAGSDTNRIVGGYSDVPFEDNQPPIVRAFIGDSTFKDGGITGSSTLLYVRLSDETGINVTGNAVGHDLIAILDGQESMPYVLNDYYETFPNNFREGVVKFPIAGLSDGEHIITVRAWDAANNSGEGAVRFRVVDGNVVAVADLMNYPNPFKEETHFVFKHNHPGEEMTAQVMIYNTAGQQVRLLTAVIPASDASHTSELVWDGTSDQGAKLPSGLYPYRMILRTANGATGTAYQKAVLVR